MYKKLDVCKIIDAHVHFVPDWMLGTRSGSAVLSTCGRWITDEGYVYQSMPDIIGDSSFSIDTLLQVMKNAGVERSIIMQGMNTDLVEETAEAVRQHPESLTGACVIDFSLNRPVEYVKACYERGLRVIKCILTVLPGSATPYLDNPMDSGKMREIWAFAEESGMTVAIDPGTPGSKSYDVEGIEFIVRNYPGLHVVICHLGLPSPAMNRKSKPFLRWEKMCDLARYDNVWFECSALSTFYIEEAYPFITAQKKVRQFMDKYGRNKVLWGSDIPGTLCDGTYRQLIDTYAKSKLLTEEEKDRLFYLNAMEAYRL